MMLFNNPFYQTSLNYQGKEALIQTITNEYEKAPSKKPSSWEENVHTSILYEACKNNLDYFEKAGIPLDLVVETDKVVQDFVTDLGISSIGKFYIAEMWYNAYSRSQYQQMHKHSNKSNMMFSGVYFMKFNQETHSATRFYNPYFEIDFDKVQDNPFFITSPKVKEDDVFIFPADVGHDVLEQTADDLRITVAFNVACTFNEKFTYE